MKTPTTDEILAASRGMDKHFDEIEEYAEQFAETHLRSSEIYHTLKKDVDNAADSEDAYYADFHLLTFILASTLSDRFALTKFLQKYQKWLAPESRSILINCRAHVPHWIIAKIIDTLPEDTYQLQDTITGEEVILYSPELTELAASNSDTEQSFIAWIVFNGVCYQLKGIVYGYYLLINDFLWYTRSLRDPKKETVTLTQLILERYLDFFTINEIGSVHIPRTFGEPDSVYWAEFPLEELPALPGKWKRETRKGFEKVSYRGTDAKLRNQTAPSVLKTYNMNPKKRSLWVSIGNYQPEITLSHDTGKALLLAHSRYDFYLILEMLKLSNGSEPYDFHPDGSVSQVYYHFATLQDHCPLPFDSYLASFRKGEDFFSRMREVINAINQAAAGNPDELDHLARILESSRESINEELEILNQTKHILISEGLPQRIREMEQAYLLDPPLNLSLTMKSRFIHRSDEYTLWADYNPDESLSIFSSLVHHPQRQADFREDPRNYIEHLFVTQFDDFEGYFIMNMTITLLHTIGNRWMAVRTYALEILNQFYELLDDIYVDDDGFWDGDGVDDDGAQDAGGDDQESAYELFIERYSRFVYRSLCRNGICSLRERPTPEALASGQYCVQRTELAAVLFPQAEEASAD
jgi:hypothetical protein